MLFINIVKHLFVADIKWPEYFKSWPLHLCFFAPLREISYRREQEEKRLRKEITLINKKNEMNFLCVFAPLRLCVQ